MHVVHVWIYFTCATDNWSWIWVCALHRRGPSLWWSSLFTSKLGLIHYANTVTFLLANEAVVQEGKKNSVLILDPFVMCEVGCERGFDILYMSVSQASVKIGLITLVKWKGNICLSSPLWDFACGPISSSFERVDGIEANSRYYMCREHVKSPIDLSSHGMGKELHQI